MESLSSYLKRSFLQNQYKKKTDMFGTVQDRVEKMNEIRRTTRHDEHFVKRNIPENMSPIMSPVISEKRKKSPKKTEQKISKRVEMLLKWKAEKEKKKLEEKNKKKPIFKVTNVPKPIGLPLLENVNREIKGKLIKSKFAPANHKFKPPSNIKPIQFDYNKETQKKSDETVNRVVTRSQTRSVNQTKSVNKQMKETVKKTLNNKQSNSRNEKEKKLPKEETASKVKEIDENVEITTPKEKSEPPMYVSPFVTISRGKDSARKEYETRKSGKSKITPLKNSKLDPTSPKAGAAYFTWLLDNQIERLKTQCEKWIKYKDEENPIEEAVSMIDVAIGQTNLLISKKFQQFRGLIDACNSGNEETPVTCEDLHGFWDMIHIQIDNIDKRFDNLEKMKANNWQEVLPEVKKIVKKRGRPPKAVKASDGLKEAIRAARMKKMDENKASEEKKTPQIKRRSRMSSFKSAENRRISSPGLVMMKVSQFAKEVDTPVKSILKSERKSVKSQSKTVIFHEDFKSDTENIENDANITNSNNKGKTPTRRSSRLSKVKLF